MTVRRIGTILVVAVIVSAFWIFYYGITRSGAPTPTRVGERPAKTVVNPEGGPPVAVATSLEIGPAGLAIPVAGIKASDLVDTYSQARAGGARVHDAIDIMAAEGTPVMAAAPGRVEKIYFSRGGGGNTVYVRSDDDRWTYYYAHLAAYAPGLHEGQHVPRGALLGYVGHTGNASADGPHLHFAIDRMGPGEKWYQGLPINPYPLLAGKTVKR